MVGSSGNNVSSVFILLGLSDSFTLSTSCHLMYDQGIVESKTFQQTYIPPQYRAQLYLEISQLIHLKNRNVSIAQ